MTTWFCFLVQYAAKSRCVKGRGRVANDIRGAGDGGSTQASACRHMRQVWDPSRRASAARRRRPFRRAVNLFCALGSHRSFECWRHRDCRSPLRNVLAKRSEAANAKAATIRTEEGLPVHSFQSLLGDLATIIRNIMALNDQSDATKVAEPPLSGTRLFIRKSCVRGARPVLVFNSLREDNAWNKKSPVVERRCGPFPFSALRWRGRRRV